MRAGEIKLEVFNDGTGRTEHLPIGEDEDVLAIKVQTTSGEEFEISFPTAGTIRVSTVMGSIEVLPRSDNVVWVRLRSIPKP